jgi:hypothetical protein
MRGRGARNVVLLPIAATLAVLAITSTDAKAATEVSSVEYPFGVRVPLGDHTYRLYLDPGTVLKQPVVEVRSGDRQWRQRGDGIWIVTLRDETIEQGPFKWNVHVVMKTDRPKRWSGWIKFRRVIPT